MWQCQNCGYSDEDGSTFDEELDPDNPEELIRYCPECGSDEVYLMEEDDELEDDDEDDDEWEEDEAEAESDEEEQ